MISFEEADALFSYEPVSGRLLRRATTGSTKTKVGSEAGWLAGPNGRRVKVNGKNYLVHRVIWLLSYKVWPSQQLDHKDGNVLNNRLGNLRDVSCRENQQNRKTARKDSGTGVRGVQKIYGSYYSVISVGGKQVRTKHGSLEDASTHRKELERTYYIQ